MRDRAFWFAVLLAVVLIHPLATFAEEQKEEKKDPSEAYQFTVEIEVERTPVKNQYRTGTCWCFATISFLESELLRTGKGEFDLSEMFVVRNTYPEKAKNSGGTDRKNEGYVYMSQAYVRLKTTAILVNKAAIPEDIGSKLQL
jgi:C1A family cysteine protease